MSKPSNYGPAFDSDDAIGAFLEVAAKICFYVGAAASTISCGLLMFYYFHFQGGVAITPNATSLVDLCAKVAIVGSVAAMIGSSYLYWGEELLHGFQLIIPGVLFAVPLFLPNFAGISGPANEIGSAALSGVQKAGGIAFVLGVLILLGELGMRIRLRAVQGSRSEQLKYGRGIQEERYQNKLLGKCWQLPYCRKFVREKCPIYHSKRTCWKERVGCMCEEEVIRNAMENRAIPKDAVAAARYIPVNNKLSSSQKAQRCKQCVIYNEHLKHKYRVLLPVTIVSFALLYFVMRGPLLEMSGGVITKINNVLQGATVGNASIQTQGVNIFKEVILDCFMFVLLAYVLKLLEFVIFKLKV